MVGAADIISDHLRRVAPDENRARIADARDQRLGVIDGEFQMLGGDAVGQRD